MILEKENKRVGIFFFYDKDGIVDEYVLYYLSSILPFFSELLIVCNGKLMPKGREDLEKLDNVTVLVRENKGFDVWAYKTGLEYFGWEKLRSEVDEMIMFNFTIMGPIDTFENMFYEMDKTDIDFWGVTVHNGAPFDPWGIMEEEKIPVHIQSHFIAVRKKMLSSFEFFQYWKDMPMICRYEEAVGLHEAIFTKKFEESGYTWTTYVDTKDLLDKTFYPMFNMPVELIKDRKCPFFKRKLFINDWDSSINENGFSAAAELYKYLQEETSYNMEWIVRHIMRTGHLSDFVSSINARYIVHENHKENIRKKVAFVIDAATDKELHNLKKYLLNIPIACDCYVIITEEAQGDRIKEIFATKNNVVYIMTEEYSDRSWLISLSGLLSQYDYICKIKLISDSYFEPLTKARSYAITAYECMLHSQEYICGIIDRFEKDPALGLMIPMSAIHAEYFGLVGNEWGTEDNYNLTKTMLEEIGCKVPLDFNKRPIVSLEDCIWVKTSSLQALLEKNNMDQIERIIKREKNLIKVVEQGEGVPDYIEELCKGIKYLYSYVAQSSGYYTAYVMPDCIGANALTNYNNTIAKINGELHHFDSVYNLMFNLATDFQKVYINFDDGLGYYHKNMLSRVITRTKYSANDIYISVPIMKNAQEMVLNIATNNMCICQNIDFVFVDEENSRIDVKYQLSNTSSTKLSEGIDVFLNKNAEYRLNGSIGMASKVIIHIDQLLIIPYFSGVEELEKKVKGGRTKSFFA